MSGMTPTAQPLENPPRFISLRWRLLFVGTLAAMIVAMVAVYGVVRGSGGEPVAVENTVLTQTAATLRTDDILARVRSEAVRAANLRGIEGLINAGDAEALTALISASVAGGGVDFISVTGADGIEITGLRATENTDRETLVPVNGADFSDLPAWGAVIETDAVLGVTISAIDGVNWLLVAVPITADTDERIGVTISGWTLQRVIDALNTSAVTDINLYSLTGLPLGSSLARNPATLGDFALAPETADASITAPPVFDQRVIGEDAYVLLYQPLTFAGGDPVALIGFAMRDTAVATAASNQQILALVASGLAGLAVIGVFVGIVFAVERINEPRLYSEPVLSPRRVRPGEFGGLMDAIDIDRLSSEIDRFAGAPEDEGDDQFRSTLNRERRERSHLMTVLDSMTDGVIIQDKDQRVVMINTTAKQLLGREDLIEGVNLRDFSALVSGKVGASVTPGVYSLGDPQTMIRGERVLTVQAGAIMSLGGGHRLGTVIIMRDTTADFEQAQLREQLLQQMAEADAPSIPDARPDPSDSQPIRTFVKQIGRHAAIMQKMIIDMRDLATYERNDAREKQRPLLVETLIWAVANDWRQVAKATGHQLQVVINKEGLYIAGDESRLRWAIGNIVDNAIKYTPAGGTVSLEIKDEIDGAVHLRVRDNGVGIGAEDVHHVMTPFYRGTPMTKSGQVLQVGGLGQGLPLAQQVISAHGGVMKVKSRAGVGTAVYFALPLAQPPAIGIEEPPIPDDATVIIPDSVDIEDYWKRPT